MSGSQMRITAAVAVLAATALFVALGVSLSHADEPKAAPPPAPPGTLPVPDGAGPAFDPAALQKAQDQMLRAMRALARDPNDAAARQQMDEARELLMGALGGGNRFALPGVDLPRLHLGAGPAAERGRLGVRLERVAPIVSDQLGIEPGTGAAITDVLKGSAAEKAGFRVHDVVTAFAGKPVADPADFARRVSAVKAGEKVDATVVRKGKVVELKGIEVPAAPAALAPDAPALPLNPAAGGKGRAVDSVSVSVSDGAFVIRAAQGGVNYVVTGKMGNDRASAEKVSIRDGDETFEAEAVDKVPERYRPTVEKLLESVGKPHAKGKVRD